MNKVTKHESWYIIKKGDNMRNGLISKCATIGILVLLISGTSAIIKNGDLNDNGQFADAGDLVLMKRASIGDIKNTDSRYDLNDNGQFADAGDLVLIKRGTIGETVISDSQIPTEIPMSTPTILPTEFPISTPSIVETETLVEPTETLVPIDEPTVLPTETLVPIDEPIALPTETSVQIEEPTTLPTERPIYETGTILKRNLDTGIGILEIHNEVNDDTVLAIANSQKESLLKVYIQKTDMYTITDIPEGTYILYYMAGKDWNEYTNKFDSIIETSRFDQELIYDPNIQGYGVTLYPVEGGNTPTTNIPESEFPN